MAQKFLAGKETGGNPIAAGKQDPLSEGIAGKRPYKSVSAMARTLANELGLRSAVVEGYMFKIPKSEDGLKGYTQEEYERIKEIVLKQMAEKGGLKPRGNMSEAKGAGNGPVAVELLKTDPERILERGLNSCSGPEYESALLGLIAKYFAGIVDSGFRANAHGNGNGKKTKGCTDVGRFASMYFTTNVRNHIATREDARELLGAFAKKWSQTLSDYSRHNEAAADAMRDCPVRSYNLEIALKIIAVQLRAE